MAGIHVKIAASPLQETSQSNFAPVHSFLIFTPDKTNPFLSMNRQQLLDLLTENEFEQLIELFNLVAPKLGQRQRETITHAASQYNGYLNEKHSGEASQEYLDTQLNKIRSSFAHIIESLPDTVFPIEKKNAALKKWGWLVALLFIAFPVYYFAKNIIPSTPEEVSVTVFVHSKKGKQDLILRQKGQVMLDIKGERKKEDIDTNGKAQFPRMNVGDEIRLNVDFSEPYRATHADSVYVIDESGHIYLEVELKGLDKIFGSVIFNDQPLSGVMVSIGSELSTTTDEGGAYQINIPEKMQQKEQEVKFIKEGFKMKIEKAFPQTQQALNVVMEKID